MANPADLAGMARYGIATDRALGGIGLPGLRAMAKRIGREEEFVKRAGFSLMCALAVHDKAAPDVAFRRFLPVIEQEAGELRSESVQHRLSVTARRPRRGSRS